MEQSSNTSDSGVSLRVEMRITGGTVKVNKESGTVVITFDEFCGSSGTIDPTIQLTVLKSCGDDRTDQKLELKFGSLLVIVHCFTYERFLEVLYDVKSGKLKERLLKEFLLIRVEIKEMEIEIMNMEEVRKTKEAMEKRYIQKMGFVH